MNGIMTILMLLIPFIDFTYQLHLDCFDMRLSYVIYLFYLAIYLPKHINGLKFTLKDNKIITAAISVIVISSLYNIYAGNNSFVLFAKQAAVIPFTFLAWVVFFKENKDDTASIVNSYLKIAIFVSCFGIFQEISYLAGFKYGYDCSSWKFVGQLSKSGCMLRATSVAGEPSMLVYALMPAFYIALHSFICGGNSFIRKYWQSSVIMICMFLTYSTIGYIGIILSVISIAFWNFKNIKYMKLTAVILAAGLFFLAGSSGIMMRVKDSVFRIQESGPTERFVNMSTYSLYLHKKITFENLKSHPLFGTGIGSYAKAFEKYYKQFHYSPYQPLLHQKDADSLFLRVASETGLFGLFALFSFIFYFCIKNFKFINKPDSYLIINNAVLIYIILRLIRNGLYYTDGLFLFILLFYYSKIFFKKQEEQYIKS